MSTRQEPPLQSQGSLEFVAGVGTSPHLPAGARRSGKAEGGLRVLSAVSMT